MLFDVERGRQRTLASGVSETVPAFSPDGQLVAFGAAHSGDGRHPAGLRVVGIDGSRERSLVPPGKRVYAIDPAWSPDGTRIAFTRVTYSPRFEPTAEIWSVAPDGSDKRLLATDAGDPAWSPDGHRIAFVSFRDRNGETCFQSCQPNGEIYVMNADGTSPQRLTRTRTGEGSPAWSPDGSQIAFHDARPNPAGYEELYAMRADGTCTTRLTNTSLANGEPAWRPGAPYAAPLVCDGVLPAARKPAMETDLRDARRFGDFPLAWLGPTYRGVLLTDVGIRDFVTFTYDDCGRVSGRCPVREVQVQTWSICRRHPVGYGGYAGPGVSDLSPHARRYRRVGKALMADYGRDFDLHTGSITVALFGPGRPARAAAVARRLRLLGRRRPALAPPRFDSRTLARVRAVRPQLRRYGMRELSRRWRMSPDQIRAALKLRRVLRPAELRQGTRCGQRPSM